MKRRHRIGIREVYTQLAELRGILRAILNEAEKEMSVEENIAIKRAISSIEEAIQHLGRTV